MEAQKPEGLEHQILASAGLAGVHQCADQAQEREREVEQGGKESRCCGVGVRQFWLLRVLSIAPEPS